MSFRVSVKTRRFKTEHAFCTDYIMSRSVSHHYVASIVDLATIVEPYKMSHTLVLPSCVTPPRDSVAMVAEVPFT